MRRPSLTTNRSPGQSDARDALLKKLDEIEKKKREAEPPPPSQSTAGRSKSRKSITEDMINLDARLKELYTKHSGDNIALDVTNVSSTPLEMVSENMKLVNMKKHPSSKQKSASGGPAGRRPSTQNEDLMATIQKITSTTPPGGHQGGTTRESTSAVRRTSRIDYGGELAGPIIGLYGAGSSVKAVGSARRPSALVHSPSAGQIGNLAGQIGNLAGQGGLAGQMGNLAGQGGVAQPKRHREKKLSNASEQPASTTHATERRRLSREMTDRRRISREITDLAKQLEEMKAAKASQQRRDSNVSTHRKSIQASSMNELLGLTSPGSGGAPGAFDATLKRGPSFLATNTGDLVVASNGFGGSLVGGGDGMGGGYSPPKKSSSTLGNTFSMLVAQPGGPPGGGSSGGGLKKSPSTMSRLQVSQTFLDGDVQRRGSHVGMHSHAGMQVRNVTDRGGVSSTVTPPPQHRRSREEGLREISKSSFESKSSKGSKSGRDRAREKSTIISTSVSRIITFQYLLSVLHAHIRAVFGVVILLKIPTKEEIKEFKSDFKSSQELLVMAGLSMNHDAIVEDDAILIEEENIKKKKPILLTLLSRIYMYGMIVGSAILVGAFTSILFNYVHAASGCPLGLNNCEWFYGEGANNFIIRGLSYWLHSEVYNPDYMETSVGNMAGVERSYPSNYPSNYYSRRRLSSSSPVSRRLSSSSRRLYKYDSSEYQLFYEVMNNPFTTEVKTVAGVKVKDLKLVGGDYDTLAEQAEVLLGNYDYGGSVISSSASGSTTTMSSSSSVSSSSDSDLQRNTLLKSRTYVDESLWRYFSDNGENVEKKVTSGNLPHGYNQFFLTSRFARIKMSWHQRREDLKIKKKNAEYNVNFLHHATVLVPCLVHDARTLVPYLPDIVYNYFDLYRAAGDVRLRISKELHGAFNAPRGSRLDKDVVILGASLPTSVPADANIDPATGNLKNPKLLIQNRNIFSHLRGEPSVIENFPGKVSIISAKREEAPNGVEADEPNGSYEHMKTKKRREDLESKQAKNVSTRILSVSDGTYTQQAQALLSELYSTIYLKSSRIYRVLTHSETIVKRTVGDYHGEAIELSDGDSMIDDSYFNTDMQESNDIVYQTNLLGGSSSAEPMITKTLSYLSLINYMEIYLPQSFATADKFFEICSYYAVFLVFSGFLIGQLNWHYMEVSGNGVITALISTATGKTCEMQVAGLRLVSALFMLSCGNTLGFEGPIIMFSVAMFQWIGRNILGKMIEPDIQSILASIGVAVGVAVCLNSPVTGIVYAMEELGSVTPFSMSKPMTGLVTFATLFAVYISRRVMEPSALGEPQQLISFVYENSTDKVLRERINLQGWMLMSFFVSVIVATHCQLTVSLIVWLRNELFYRVEFEVAMGMPSFMLRSGAAGELATGAGGQGGGGAGSASAKTNNTTSRPSLMGTSVSMLGAIPTVGAIPGAIPGGLTRNPSIVGGGKTTGKSKRMSYGGAGGGPGSGSSDALVSPSLGGLAGRASFALVGAGGGELTMPSMINRSGGGGGARKPSEKHSEQVDDVEKYFIAGSAVKGSLDDHIKEMTRLSAELNLPGQLLPASPGSGAAEKIPAAQGETGTHSGEQTISPAAKPRVDNADEVTGAAIAAVIKVGSAGGSDSRDSASDDDDDAGEGGATAVGYLAPAAWDDFDEDSEEDSDSDYDSDEEEDSDQEISDSEIERYYGNYQARQNCGVSGLSTQIGAGGLPQPGEALGAVGPGIGTRGCAHGIMGNGTGVQMSFVGGNPDVFLKAVAANMISKARGPDGTTLPTRGNSIMIPRPAGVHVTRGADPGGDDDSKTPPSLLAAGEDENKDKGLGYAKPAMYRANTMGVNVQQIAEDEEDQEVDERKDAPGTLPAAVALGTTPAVVAPGTATAPDTSHDFEIAKDLADAERIQAAVMASLEPGQDVTVQNASPVAVDKASEARSYQPEQELSPSQSIAHTQDDLPASVPSPIGTMSEDEREKEGRKKKEKDRASSSKLMERAVGTPSGVVQRSGTPAPPPAAGVGMTGPPTDTAGRYGNTFPSGNQTDGGGSGIGVTAPPVAKAPNLPSITGGKSPKSRTPTGGVTPIGMGAVTPPGGGPTNLSGAATPSGVQQVNSEAQRVEEKLRRKREKEEKREKARIKKEEKEAKKAKARGITLLQTAPTPPSAATPAGGLDVSAAPKSSGTAGPGLLAGPATVIQKDPSGGAGGIGAPGGMPDSPPGVAGGLGASGIPRSRQASISQQVEAKGASFIPDSWKAGAPQKKGRKGKNKGEKQSMVGDRRGKKKGDKVDRKGKKSTNKTGGPGNKGTDSIQIAGGNAGGSARLGTDNRGDSKALSGRQGTADIASAGTSISMSSAMVSPIASPSGGVSRSGTDSKRFRVEGFGSSKNLAPPSTFPSGLEKSKSKEKVPDENASRMGSKDQPRSPGAGSRTPLKTAGAPTGGWSGADIVSLTFGNHGSASDRLVRKSISQLKTNGSREGGKSGSRAGGSKQSSKERSLEKKTPDSGASSDDSDGPKKPKKKKSKQSALGKDGLTADGRIPPKDPKSIRDPSALTPRLLSQTEGESGVRLSQMEDTEGNGGNRRSFLSILTTRNQNARQSMRGRRSFDSQSAADPLIQVQQLNRRKMQQWLWPANALFIAFLSFITLLFTNGKFHIFGIRNILTMNHTNIFVFFVLLVCKTLGTVTSLAIDAPGGILTPFLEIGIYAGGFIGALIEYMLCHVGLHYPAHPLYTPMDSAKILSDLNIGNFFSNSGNSDADLVQRIEEKIFKQAGAYYEEASEKFWMDLAAQVGGSVLSARSSISNSTANSNSTNSNSANSNSTIATTAGPVTGDSPFFFTPSDYLHYYQNQQSEKNNTTITYATSQLLLANDGNYARYLSSAIFQNGGSSFRRHITDQDVSSFYFDKQLYVAKGNSDLPEYKTKHLGKIGLLRHFLRNSGSLTPKLRSKSETPPVKFNYSYQNTFFVVRCCGIGLCAAFVSVFRFPLTSVVMSIEMCKDVLTFHDKTDMMVVLVIFSSIVAQMISNYLQAETLVECFMEQDGVDVTGCWEKINEKSLIVGHGHQAEDSEEGGEGDGEEAANTGFGTDNGMMDEEQLKKRKSLCPKKGSQDSQLQKVSSSGGSQNHRDDTDHDHIRSDPDSPGSPLGTSNGMMNNTSGPGRARSQSRKSKESGDVSDEKGTTSEGDKNGKNSGHKIDGFGHSSGDDSVGRVRKVESVKSSVGGGPESDSGPGSPGTHHWKPVQHSRE